MLIDPATSPDDIVMPGHMFPLRARDGGVLVRAGHTEATVDLCRLAGLYPSAVLCEIKNPDGTMARLPDLKRFGKRHDLKIISIAELIRYRTQRELLIQRVASTTLPTKWGEFKLHAYRSEIDPDEHGALVYGDISGPEPVLVRVHSQCVSGDVFDSLRCDCGGSCLPCSRSSRVEAPSSTAQEGRGIASNKVAPTSYKKARPRHPSKPTKPSVRRGPPHYGIGMQISWTSASEIRLLTNNPPSAPARGYSIEVVERVPIMATPTNQPRYLETKRDKLGHFIEMRGRRSRVDSFSLYFP